MRFARTAALMIALCAAAFSAAAVPAVASATAQSPAGLVSAQATASAPTAGQAASCCHRAHLHARLTGSSAYPRARGSADYRQGCCRRRELTVDVWNISALAGKSLAVWANGTKVGTSTVTSGGSFHFHRSGSGVPRLAPGEKIAVKRSSGALVASGTLRRTCC